jgi:tRNA-dihydrouridine synthase 1
MVDQSELAFRILSRRYGADVAYTPMINAKMYVAAAERGKVRREAFDLEAGEEGIGKFLVGGQDSASESGDLEGQLETDRPLVIQFCGNNPSLILQAAKAVSLPLTKSAAHDSPGGPTPRCDAIDINLGCPQDIARRGGYGAWLMDDWERVYDISACCFSVSSIFPFVPIFLLFIGPPLSS